MKDEVSKVLFKKNLEISFFWDYMEAQIVWRFKEKNKNHIGVDHIRIRSKYLVYENSKALSKFKGQKK